jgi:hypothetical protein
MGKVKGEDEDGHEEGNPKEDTGEEKAYSFVGGTVRRVFFPYDEFSCAHISLLLVNIIPKSIIKIRDLSSF